ncbi:MAG: Flp pilus assembly protein CpaB [Bacteriovoracia bacterium]
MNNRAIVLSIFMAGLAVFFMQTYVSSIENEAEKKFGTQVLVVVAAKDIREMDTITENMLEMKSVPKQFLEPASVWFNQKVKDDDSLPKDMRALSGSVAIVPIKKGEQLTYNKLTEPSIRTGLAPQVTPGRRAVTIPVNEVTGVGKLVKPGDRVDLIAVMEVGVGLGAVKVAKTVLQDVGVLAVGRNVTNNVARVLEDSMGDNKMSLKSLTRFDGFASVTVEVEPGDAQKLALIAADNKNTIALSLRNNDDNDRVSAPGLSMQDVLGDAARLPANNGLRR